MVLVPSCGRKPGIHPQASLEILHECAEYANSTNVVSGLTYLARGNSSNVGISDVDGATRIGTPPEIINCTVTLGVFGGDTVIFPG
jgi:hypothetical protein